MPFLGKKLTDEEKARKRELEGILIDAELSKIEITPEVLAQLKELCDIKNEDKTSDKYKKKINSINEDISDIISERESEYNRIKKAIKKDQEKKASEYDAYLLDYLDNPKVAKIQEKADAIFAKAPAAITEIETRLKEKRVEIETKYQPYKNDLTILKLKKREQDQLERESAIALREVSISLNNGNLALIKAHNSRIWNEFKDEVKSNFAEGTGVSESSTTNNQSMADELRTLKSLLDEGILTKEEFDTEKEKILNNTTKP